MVLDTVVIGAGAMGSSTAYWLSKFQDVALIEQFNLLHTNGSSHGQSRVIRKTYRQDYFSSMMHEAYDLWRSVQDETHTIVFHQIGGLDVAKENNQDLLQTLNICEKTHLRHEVLDARELKNRYPAYEKVGDDYLAIYQPETGILNATKAVNMFQQRAAGQGAQIIQNSPVTSIRDLGDHVLIETKAGSYHAENVVITAGSWINQILSKLDLYVQTQIWKLTFAYFKIKEIEKYLPRNFPVFIHWDNTDDYGFPIHEKDGFVKIAPHVNELIEKTDDNDNQNHVNDGLVDHLKTFVENVFTGIDTSNYTAETCLYTMTRNENFIMDKLPETDNIFIAGGFSGHGFKFTPLVGKIMQQMVMGEEVKYDLRPFELSNFIK